MQECTTAKLSAGSPAVIPGGRLLSNTTCPCEIIIHVAPVRAAGSDQCHLASVIHLKQIIKSTTPLTLLVIPVQPDGSIPNRFVTSHLSKRSGGESGSKAQGWKMEMTVKKGMWGFTSTRSWQGREEQGERGRRSRR